MSWQNLAFNSNLYGIIYIVMNLIHIIDCYYYWIWIQSAIDNERCLWLWGSNANVNYGNIYSVREGVQKYFLAKKKKKKKKKIFTTIFQGPPFRPQNFQGPNQIFCHEKWVNAIKILCYFFQGPLYKTLYRTRRIKTFKGGTAPLGLIFEDFVHFLKK